MSITIQQQHLATYCNQPVYQYLLTHTSGFSVGILNYGAIIWQLNTLDRHGNLANVVYQPPQFNPANPGHCGALTGRCAGRIANAQFDLAGISYQLEANFGRHNLHGGTHGLDKQWWQVSELTDGLRLSHHSPALSGGFPGTLEVTLEYRIVSAWDLAITMHATTDAKTIVNLTNHSYFDLAGNRQGSPWLQLAVDYFAELNQEFIPTGKLIAVAGTPFDLRCPRSVKQGLTIPHPQLSLANGYDHPFILKPEQPYPIKLSDPDSGRYLQIATTEPVCVVYSANHLAAKGSLLCLETQRMPNAINLAGYQEQVIIDPTTPYYSHSLWHFGVTHAAAGQLN
jgi:aldose 1-epimerase